ncbi:MAG: Rpn family recombination-promoting nuclease/putative transposase [Acholeplasmatales bacterium]|nr:Rpn family recombination-promoting nuclease/putative transposase [Acholeplasmatales bacterium]
MPNKRKDNILKDYMGKNDIFADIVNFCLYDGKKVVNEKDLKELDTTFVNENEDIFEKSRDLLKEVNIKSDNKNTYILFGIENQTNIDKEMVFRVLLYDALTYRKQFKNKSKYGKID